MSIHSSEIWADLSEPLRQQVKEELITIFQEVIREHIRSHHTQASGTPGHDLHPSIQPAASTLESVEPAPAVRATAAGEGTRLVSRSN